jgi:ribonuclease D
LINKYGEDILKAIQVGLEKKHITRKRKPKPSPEYIKKYDALKEWRKNKSNSLSVDSDIVLPKEHLEQLSHLENIKIENIQIIMENIPYRFSLFGKEILSILENKEGL